MLAVRVARCWLEEEEKLGSLSPNASSMPKNLLLSRLNSPTRACRSARFEIIQPILAKLSPNRLGAYRGALNFKLIWALANPSALPPGFKPGVNE